MTSSDESRLDGDAESEQAVSSAWATLAPLMDLVTPMALRVVATMRLADFVPDDGDDAGVDVGELASRVGADPEALARMLRHLVCHGVFTEPQPGQFAAGPAAALLRSTHPASMRAWLDLDGFGGRMDLAFTGLAHTGLAHTGLAHTVRTGEPAWETVFGQPFWAYLDANPAIGVSFDSIMAADADYRSALVDGYDRTGIRHVTDVGGGTGRLLGDVLRNSPHLRGTLLDLPETVARGREYLAGLGLDSRCDVAGQSFFDPLPAGADAYLLNRVIHDWDDAHASQILRRCAEAAGDQGRVLVIESHGTGDDDPAASQLAAIESRLCEPPPAVAASHKAARNELSS